MESKRFNKLLEYYKLSERDFTEAELENLKELPAKNAERLFAVRSKEVRALNSRLVRTILSKPLDSLTDKDIRDIVNKGDKGDILKLVEMLLEVHAEQKKSIDELCNDFIEVLSIVRTALNEGVIESDILKNKFGKDMPKRIDTAKSPRKKSVIDG